jgi:hypothetical protein
MGAGLREPVASLGHSARTGSGPFPVLGLETASAAQVTARAMAALDASHDMVLHAVQFTRTPEGTYRAEMWFDERSPGSFRSLTFDDAGRPAYDSATRVDPDGTVRTRTIDLLAGTWSEQTREPSGGGAPLTEGDRIRRMLEEGHLTVLRQERYDGRPALVLADDEPGMNREIWVAPDS